MTNKSKKVLVTGASGAIAPILVSELIAQNHHVKVLIRNPNENLLPKETEIIIGDLRDETALEKAVADAEWIFHFAAKLHINNPNEKLKAEYQAVNVKATKKLLEISRNHCEKFIFASTINVYGTTDGTEIFDEKSPLDPVGIYAQTKAEAEKFVLAEKSGVVLRLAAVYGSRMKGNFPRLVKAIKKGRFVFIGKGDNRRTLIHAKDVVKAAILCAENENANGNIYNVTDGEIHTLYEIVEAIAKALNKKTPNIKLPIAFVKPLVGIGDNLTKLIGKPLNLRNMLEKINEDMAISGTKIQKELGFKPEFDLKKGWEETVKYI